MNDCDAKVVPTLVVGSEEGLLICVTQLYSCTIAGMFGGGVAIDAGVSNAFRIVVIIMLDD